MSGRAPTAYQLYFGELRSGEPRGGEPRGDPERNPARLRALEEAFFGALWIRNGTSKLTYRGRFADLDTFVQALLPGTLLPPGEPLDILDVGVSSGVSTAEWLDSLERAGIRCRMVGGDLVMDAFLLSAGGGIRALIDRSGFLMHLELAGRPLRLPPPRRCGARLHLHVLNALRAASAPALRYLLHRLQRSPHRSLRALKLVSPSLAARGSIDWVEDDILSAARDPRRFHVVRAANVLNRRYFDELTLERMLINLRERMRPLGLLVVCRTLTDRTNHATVFRLEPDGRFCSVGRLNEGSEIADLVLRLPDVPLAGARAIAITSP